MSERYNQYDGWAWLYDETIGPIYGREQMEILKRVLLPLLEPGAHLFDLCCGTGQLIEGLCKAGYQVTGLDSSKEMLERARKNAPGADYILEDARIYRASETFDAAFSTSASLNHVPSIDDLEQVFENVLHSLCNGGVFVFDLNHHEQMSKWWRGNPLEGTLTKEWAWIVTPYYQVSERKGSFLVKTFRGVRARGFLRGFKTIFYRLLAKPRFIGLRLKWISKLKLLEPSWICQEMRFPVVGHDLIEVREVLMKVGFSKVELQSLDGNDSVDSDHSAYFICSKGGSK